MSDSKNPFEMMMAQAGEMAKAMNPALETFSAADALSGMQKLWPTMPKELMEMSFGKGVSENGLDAKTRLLLTLAGLTIQGAQNETQVQVTVRHARAAGALNEEIAETIAQMSMFAGIPAMNRAMKIAQEVLAETEENET